MKLETLLTLLAVGGVGWLVWNNYQPEIRSIAKWGIVPAGAPAYTGTSVSSNLLPVPGPNAQPNCQVPCPADVMCAAELNGILNGAGVCVRTQRFNPAVPPTLTIN